MRATQIFPWTLLLIFVVSPLPADEGASAQKPRMVSLMPDVVGKTQGEAQKHLRAANVAVRLVREASSQVGRVLSQRPVGGTAMEPGAIAVLHVGVANDVPTVVPRLVGRDIDEVRKRYEAIYVLEVVEVPARDGQQPGIVLAQKPAPGTKHPYRGRVQVDLIRRPSVVPDVVGKNAKVARALVEAAGFAPVVTTEERAGILPGSVLAQEPAAHTPAAPGAVVRLVVSGGSAPLVPLLGTPPEHREPVTCPDFAGLSFHDAHLWARALGLVPVSKFLRADDLPSFQVIQQGTRAGSPVYEGAPVALTVGRRSEPPKDLPVPILLGYGREEAKRILEGMGYQPRFVGRPSPLPAGLVVEQLPRAGRPAAQGSDLVLYVAEATPRGWVAPQIKLPELRKRDLEEGLAFLYRINMSVRVHAVPTRGTPMNLVVHQEPPAGTSWRMGQAVTLHVPERVRVPNVVGLDPAQARTRLQAVGLRSAPVAGPDPYVVTRQIPAADRVVSRGSAMRLEVTVRPPDAAALVVVPDVRGHTLTRARAILQPLGLVLQSSGVGAQAAIGSQDPSPGQQVAPGSTVTVRVGR